MDKGYEGGKVMARSIIEPQDANTCFECGCSGYLEEHHIFFGNPLRKKSEKYGLKVHLCYLHHRDSKEGAHFNKELDLKLKRIAQKAWEDKHQPNAREKFMRAFWKNYLDEE